MRAANVLASLYVNAAESKEPILLGDALSTEINKEKEHLIPISHIAKVGFTWANAILHYSEFW